MLEELREEGNDEDANENGNAEETKNKQKISPSPSWTPTYERVLGATTDDVRKIQSMIIF